MLKSDINYNDFRAMFNGNFDARIKVTGPAGQDQDKMAFSGPLSLMLHH